MRRESFHIWNFQEAHLVESLVALNKRPAQIADHIFTELLVKHLVDCLLDLGELRVEVSERANAAQILSQDVLTHCDEIKGACELG